MDKIILRDAAYSVRIGINKTELQHVQPLILDIALFYWLAHAGESDDLAKTINYSEVNKLLQNLFEEKSFALIECVADQVCRLIFNNFPVWRIKLRIKKPQAIRNVGYTGVEIERARTQYTKGLRFNISY